MFFRWGLDCHTCIFPYCGWWRTSMKILRSKIRLPSQDLPSLKSVYKPHELAWYAIINWVSISISLSISISFYIYIYIYIFIFIYIYIFIFIYIYIYIYLSINQSIYLYIYTLIYVYIIYIHVPWSYEPTSSYLGGAPCKVILFKGPPSRLHRCSAAAAGFVRGASSFQPRMTINHPAVITICGLVTIPSHGWFRRFFFPQLLGFIN